MVPWHEIDRATAPGGGELSLHRRGHEFVIRVDNQLLMSSTSHASEVKLAELGCASLKTAPAPRVLIGGLGMGFTLRAALDVLPPDAEVVVAEIAACVVAWNRDMLAHLAQNPLADPRASVYAGDVGALLRTTKTRFDAILLDVDNGPQGLTRPGNQGLYSDSGLMVARRVLRPGGVFAVWSAAPHPGFERRMQRAGFHCEVHRARAAAGKRSQYVVYLGKIDTRAAAWAKLQDGKRRHRPGQ